MNIFFSVGRAVIYAIWIVFWLSVLMVRFVKKDEWAAAFAGIKKMVSGVTVIFVFFVFFNFILWTHKLSIMNNFPAQWTYLASVLGYAFLLAGFVMAMKTVWKLWKPLPSNISKNKLYMQMRNTVYASFLLIGLGSSVVLMNTTSFIAIIAILIPLLAYRVKIENKANANL